MAKVKGFWTFKDTIEELPEEQDVIFISSFMFNGDLTFQKFNKIRTGYYSNLPFKALWYHDIGGYKRNAYNYEDCPEEGEEIGWVFEKTINFETEQEVSVEFYDWLVRNTIPNKMIKGKWVFNDVLTEFTERQYVNFTFNNYAYEYIQCGNTTSSPKAETMFYGFKYHHSGGSDGRDESGSYDWKEEAQYCYYDESGSGTGWYTNGSKIIDFGKVGQQVTEDFYAWLSQNAKRQIRGKWTFKDVLTLLPVAEDVNFTSNNESYIGFFIDNGRFSISDCALCYKILDEDSDVGYGGHGVYFYEAFISFDGYHYDAGWNPDLSSIEAYKTINFGIDGEFVSTVFYDWLVNNAVYTGNTIVDITTPGVTTLGTAGMICDRNIDVNVDLLAPEQAVVRSILERTITEYYDDATTILGTSAFRNCQALTRVEFTNLQSIGSLAFSYCSVLTEVILRSKSVVQLTGEKVFHATPIGSSTSYIYVPDNLVEEYRQSTNWSVYRNRIMPLRNLT